jgi:inorganic pyrophosphatase
METNLETLPIGEGAPRLLNTVIEVPVGSRNKYEYEPDLGVIMRDRVLPGPCATPQTTASYPPRSPIATTPWT